MTIIVDRNQRSTKKRKASAIEEIVLQLELDKTHLLWKTTEQPATPSTVAGSPLVGDPPPLHRCSKTHSFNVDSELDTDDFTIWSVSSAASSLSFCRARKDSQHSTTSSKKSVTFSDDENETIAIPCRRDEQDGHEADNELSTSGTDDDLVQHEHHRHGHDHLNFASKLSPSMHSVFHFGMFFDDIGNGHGFVFVGAIVCFFGLLLRMFIDDMISIRSGGGGTVDASGSANANAHQILWLLFDVSLAYAVGFNGSSFFIDEELCTNRIQPSRGQDNLMMIKKNKMLQF